MSDLFLLLFFFPQTLKQNKRISEIVIMDRDYACHFAQLTLVELIGAIQQEDLQKIHQWISVQLSGHWIILQNLSLSFDSTQFTGGNFKEQPGTELTKITQQLNFERTIETQNRLGWKEHLVHNYMLFFYKIGQQVHKSG